MNRAKVRWVWVGICCLIFASAGCRDREPTPRYNRNLGTSEQPLMPTPAVYVGTPLPQRTVDIPDRTNPGELTHAAAADSSNDTGSETGGVISSFLNRLRNVAGQPRPAEPPPDTEEE